MYHMEVGCGMGFIKTQATKDFIKDSLKKGS